MPLTHSKLRLRNIPRRGLPTGAAAKCSKQQSPGCMGDVLLNVELPLLSSALPKAMCCRLLCKRVMSACCLAAASM